MILLFTPAMTKLMQWWLAWCLVGGQAPASSSHDISFKEQILACKMKGLPIEEARDVSVVQIAVLCHLVP